jgi:hypothetical protein
VNIKDIRVGMWLVFGQEDKRRMTKGKVYEVLDIEDGHLGEIGIVEVLDDTGVKRGFFARRFERIADMPQVGAPVRKFQIGDVVANNFGNEYHVIGINADGFLHLQRDGMIFRGNGIGVDKEAHGYDPERFNLVRAVANAPAAAPEAPQQAAVGEAIPKYVPKVGDRVRLINGRGLPRNPNAGWVQQFDRRVGLDFVVSEVVVDKQYVHFENDNGAWAYSFDWLQLEREAAPARPFAVGDIVEEKKFPNQNSYKVLKLLGDNRIDISFSDRLDVRMGTWSEDLFQLVKRGNGAEAKPAIIQLKIGDLVKVVKAFKSSPKLHWNELMEDTIGKVYKIHSYDDWAKAYQLSNGWMYLAESLELAKEEDIKVAKKKTAQPSLRDLIAQSRKEDIKGVGGVSSYVVFLKDKKTGEITMNKHLKDVCHARLAVYYAGREDVKEAVAVIDYQQAHEKQALAAGKQYKATYRKFVDYIVNRSPWAVAFQGKTVKNVLENGVLMNVEAPSGAVAGACQALRYLSEFKAQNAVWKLMMDNGIQEDAAFLTTYAFIAEKDGNYTKHPMGGGHQPINGEITAGSLISFFANGYDEKFLKSEPYRTKTSYRVHEHVEAVKDVLKMPETYNDFVLNATEWTDVKDGWAVVKKATEEQVLAFAKRLEQLINKARAA